MKRIIMLLLLLFISTNFIYSVEVTLGFGWRISDSGMVLGELSFPFTNYRIIEEGDHDGSWFRASETSNYTLSEEINLFQRRAYFIFGMDFFLYKKQVSLGFELSAGYLKRNNKIHTRNIAEVVDEYIIYDETSEDEREITIIPANFFLIAKYKFDSIKNRVGWFRPYIGVGGGLNAVVFIDAIEIFDENDINIGEKVFTHSGALLAMVGFDFLFSQKAGAFIEFRYIKPLSEGKNFRDQSTFGIGFRFI